LGFQNIWRKKFKKIYPGKGRDSRKFRFWGLEIEEMVQFLPFVWKKICSRVKLPYLAATKKKFSL
jgi:hypothetical protein